MKAWLTKSFREAAWAPLTVVAFYAIAAKVFDAYIFWPHMDIPTHFAGGLAVTYFFAMSLAHAEAVLGSMSRGVRLMLALGLTSIAAVVWEFGEFASDIFLGTKMSLGMTDTLSDLFFGLLGGLVVIVVLAGRKPPNKAPEPTPLPVMPPAEPEVTPGSGVAHL